MKQYMLSVIYPEGGEPPPPEEFQKIRKNVQAVRDELKAAGAWVFSGALHPATTATMVKFNNGQVLTTDGPYAETKEQVGGFSIIKVADLDQAIRWAGKFSQAIGVSIEVRPLQEH